MNLSLSWPQDQSALSDIADQIARLFASPVAVVLAHLPRELEGYKIASEMNLSPVESDGLIHFVKSCTKKVNSDLYRVRRIQLASPVGVLVQNLTYVHFGELKASGPVAYGTVILGTTKPIGAREELALLVVVQRLGELARVSELQEEIHLQSQFLSIASHELKTPLTSIYGILQLQARMLKAAKNGQVLSDQDRYDHFLKMNIRQVERLNELIDGLLDVSRIQNGRFVVEPSETQIVQILQDCIQSRLQVIAQEAGVSIQLDSPQSLVAWVDPVRFEELVTNLVMNAIRFSPEGGVVWVRLKEESVGFRFTVRDQGPSVPDEDRERIFQPFERAQRTSRLGGLGLGLFISRQIAQLHGGNVSLIESVPGKGNAFEAYFPIRNPRAV